MNSTGAYARHIFKSKLTVVYGNTTVYVFVVKLSILINQLVDDVEQCMNHTWFLDLMKIIQEVFLWYRPLTIIVWFMVFNATFINISAR